MCILNLRESFFQAQILMQRVRGGARGADSGTPGTEARAAALVEGGVRAQTHAPASCCLRQGRGLSVQQVQTRAFRKTSNGVDLPIPLPKPAANYREPDARRGVQGARVQTDTCCLPLSSKPSPEAGAHLTDEGAAGEAECHVTKPEPRSLCKQNVASGSDDLGSRPPPGRMT